MRYFTVLAEELNFTRAARRLHIAQPALSQQVKALERRLGARLIERGSTGCTLTAVGEVVAQEARGSSRGPRRPRSGSPPRSPVGTAA